MKSKTKAKRKIHGLPRPEKPLTPLEEFMVDIPPEEAYEALLEFQLNWCDHDEDDREKITSNPAQALCWGCGLIWPWGRKPPKGDL
jgi:hypothetical protein